MRIVFVRHGEPDYEKDCLTDLGHIQAEAVGKRLSSENISKLYSSTMGRARETAEHIAAELGISHDDITALDSMREIEWDFEGPWEVATKAVSAQKSIMDGSRATDGIYSKDKICGFLLKRGEDFDSLLTSHGFAREGLYYRVTAENDETILLASHAGTSTAILSHLFNLPAPFVFDAIRPHFTAVTIVMLNGQHGELISPRFEIANDSRHIKGIGL